MLPLLAAVLGLIAMGRPSADAPDLWRLLASIAPLDDEERRGLEGGARIVKILDSAEASHLVVFAGSRITVPPQEFAERIRRSAQLWRSPQVPRTGTFSAPVRLDDVAGMKLPPDDVEALRRCRPSACAVKLSAREIARLQAAIATGRDWGEAAQREFRQIVIDRIAAYQRGGLSAFDPFHDHDSPIDPRAEFSRILSRAQALTRLAPRLVEYLERYPRTPLPEGADEHMYWMESVHPPKPMIQAWHVVVDRRPPGGTVDAIVLSRQIFATHYLNGSLAMTALVGGDDGRRYMFYLNRTSADGLDGFLPGLRRFFIERRVRSGARAAFDWVVGRLERGPVSGAGAALLVARDRQEELLPIARYQEESHVVLAHLLQRLHRLRGGRDFPAVDLKDHIPGPDPGAGSRTARFDAADERPGAAGVVEGHTEAGGLFRPLAGRRLAERELFHPDVHGRALAVAHNSDGNVGARRGRDHHVNQIACRPDGFATVFDDHVAGAEARPRGRTVLLDHRDERPVASLQPEVVEGHGGYLGDPDADPPARDFSVPELREELLDDVHRNREPDPQIAGTPAAAQDGGVDPDHFAAQVHEWTAGITRIDRRIRLEQHLLAAGHRLKWPAFRADDADRHRVREAERVADRDHQIAGPHQRGIAERGDRQI
jgi:hypothetical protein